MAATMSPFPTTNRPPLRPDAPGALINMRKAYGEALVRLGGTHPNVVVLSADVSNSDFSFMFQEVYPERFFNVGIAEQSLVDVAAGLAYTGKVALANTFAFLFATRALEMVRTHLCYGGANVKLMAAYAGISDSYDGPTHHAISDLAILRSLPNMTVVVPGDTLAVAKFLPLVADWDGPVYFRMNRNEVPLLFDESYTPQIGKAIRLRPGNDLTLVACGLMVSRCLEAAHLLEKEGIMAAVLEVHTLKPLDEQAILQASEETGALVTAEEHSILGGLGGAVAEVVSERCPRPVVRVGIADRFAESGPYPAILDRYGLSVPDVVAGAKKALKLKGKGENAIW